MYVNLISFPVGLWLTDPGIARDDVARTQYDAVRNMNLGNTTCKECPTPNQLQRKRLTKRNTGKKLAFPKALFAKFFNTKLIRYKVFQFADTTVADSMIFAYQQPQNDIKEAVGITNCKTIQGTSKKRRRTNGTKVRRQTKRTESSLIKCLYSDRPQ